MRYIQLVALAVLAISDNVEPWKLCEEINVFDWANCTCHNGQWAVEYICDGVNITLANQYNSDDYLYGSIKKMVISCNESIRSTSDLPILDVAYMKLVLELKNCLPFEVPLPDILGRLRINETQELFLEGKVDTLSRGELANLTNVEKVTMYELGLIHIDPFVFGDKDAPDNSIKTLFISQNNISELDHRVFSLVKQLTFLIISNNQLSSLPDDLLLHNTNLADLWIYNTRLEHFSSKLLRNQGRLRKLVLKNNRLKHISGEWTGLENLVSLDLSHNQLTSLGEGEESVFRHLPKLKHLLLHNNNLTRLYRDWTRHESIRGIALYRNNFQSIEVESFAEVTHDLYISLESNNITTVNLDSHQTEVAKDTVKAVVTVNLENNPFNCDCHFYSFVKYARREDIFISFPDVRVALEMDRFEMCLNPPVLKDRRIKYLPLEELTCPISDGCPAHCSCYYRPEGSYTVVNCSGVGLDMEPQSLPAHINSSETQVILSHNQLVEFTYSADLWPNVTELDLSNNSLSTFNASDGTGRLKKLDISHNQLTSLLDDTVRHLQSLESLSLHHNPWLCSENQQLVSLIKEPHNVTIHLIDQTTCTVPMKDLSYNVTCPLIDS